MWKFTIFAATTIMAVSFCSSLRIVQYNAEWLFVDHYSGFDCPGTQCTWKNTTEATTHLGYVSRVIDTLQPDIVNICEVEGIHELQMVADSVYSTKLMPFLVPGTDTATGQNVGMLTTSPPNVALYRTEQKIAYPISGSKCGYTGAASTTGVSKHYITEFDLPGNITAAFISAHLIAIPTDPARCAQREAQATILRGVVSDYVAKGYEIIVLGDMNDYDGTVPDINQHQPISRVLDILRGDDLVNIAERIPSTERFSDWWDSDDNCNTASVADYSMIDHILVSPGIQKHISDVFVYHGYAEYCGKYNSDHYPVVIDITP